MSEYTQTREEIIKEQAEAEAYAPMGEKSQLKDNWEELEAELQALI